MRSLEQAVEFSSSLPALPSSISCISPKDVHLNHSIFAFSPPEPEGLLARIDWHIDLEFNKQQPDSLLALTPNRPNVAVPSVADTLE